MLGGLKGKFEEKAPNWLYASIATLYLGLHPYRERIAVIPYGNLWLLAYRDLRLLAANRQDAHYFSVLYQEYCTDEFEVDPSDIVLDVGAWVGWFTVPAAKRAGKGGLVIAVEPEPKNLAFLKANVSTLSNVRVVEKCAWRCKKRIKLYLDRSTTQHSAVIPPTPTGYIWVQADTLDNVVSELGVNKVNFIKIDVEGAELEVLEGAERVLKTAKKVAVAAYHPRDGKQTWPEVKRFLEARGFKTHVTPVKIVRAWKRA